VILYGAPGCWKCVEVAEALDALGLEHEEVTVRGDPVARAVLVAAQGEPPQVPMLVDGGYRGMPAHMGGVCAVDGGCADDGAAPGH
jgi:glutaredoxin